MIIKCFISIVVCVFLASCKKEEAGTIEKSQPVIKYKGKVAKGGTSEKSSPKIYQKESVRNEEGKVITYISEDKDINRLEEAIRLPIQLQMKANKLIAANDNIKTLEVSSSGLKIDGKSVNTAFLDKSGAELYKLKIPGDMRVADYAKLVPYKYRMYLTIRDGVLYCYRSVLSCMCFGIFFKNGGIFYEATDRKFTSAEFKQQLKQDRQVNKRLINYGFWDEKKSTKMKEVLELAELFKIGVYFRVNVPEDSVHDDVPAPIEEPEPVQF